MSGYQREYKIGPYENKCQTQIYTVSVNIKLTQKDEGKRSRHYIGSYNLCHGRLNNWNNQLKIFTSKFRNSIKQFLFLDYV